MREEERLARNAARLRQITGGLFEAPRDPLMEAAAAAQRKFNRAIAAGDETAINAAFWECVDTLAALADRDFNALAE